MYLREKIIENSFSVEGKNSITNIDLGRTAENKLDIDWYGSKIVKIKTIR